MAVVTSVLAVSKTVTVYAGIKRYTNEVIVMKKRTMKIKTTVFAFILSMCTCVTNPVTTSAKSYQWLQKPTLTITTTKMKDGIVTLAPKKTAQLKVKYGGKIMEIKGKRKIKIVINDKYTTVTTKVKYTSSNTKVASVNKKGKITAKKKGKCTIYAKYKGITKKIKVKVHEHIWKEYMAEKYVYVSTGYLCNCGTMFVRMDNVASGAAISDVTVNGVPIGELIWFSRTENRLTDRKIMDEKFEDDHAMEHILNNEPENTTVIDFYKIEQYPDHYYCECGATKEEKIISCFCPNGYT